MAKGRGHEFSVAPGETQRFVVLAAGHAVIGEPHAINIIATDGYLNPAEPKFRGSVRLDFDGAPRMEIIREAFLDTDDGIKTIMWTPEEPGTVRVIVDDSTGRRGVSNPILVLEEPPKETIYFGDMGVRSEFSGGRGTVAENLEFARDVGYLDFCRVADRSNLLTSTRWAVSQRQADRFNRDGEFVAFVGYEWNDAAAADDTRSPGTRTVISGGDRLPLVNHGDTGSSLRQLWTRVGEAEEILAFANHPIEDESWDQYNPAFETAVEIYSSYGPSENRGQRPVHDEQGRGISVEEILSTGARVFLIGNSSGHEGVPGINQLESLVRSLHGWRPFSGGLTGVMAEDLTRSCILEAIRAGRVYATTGNRTLLSFSLNEAPMGSELRLRARERRHFSARIVADGQLRRVEIIRNGESVVSQTAAGGIHTLNWEDRVRTAGEDYYYLRVTMWDTGLAWSSPIWVRPIGDNRLSQDLGRDREQSAGGEGRGRAVCRTLRTGALEPRVSLSQGAFRVSPESVGQAPCLNGCSSARTSRKRWEDSSFSSTWLSTRGTIQSPMRAPREFTNSSAVSATRSRLSGSAGLIQRKASSPSTPSRSTVTEVPGHCSVSSVTISWATRRMFWRLR